MAVFPTASHIATKAPPAGPEPAASGLRARRHHLFDHGGTLENRLFEFFARWGVRECGYPTLRRHGSGGRTRTCASRVTVARLTTRPHRNERRRRQQDSNLRAVARLRDSSALPCLARPCLRARAEGEGVEPPRPGEGPPVFETGYRTSGSPSRAVEEVAPAGLEPATR